MKLEEVQEVLEATPVFNISLVDKEVSSCHASDLISDMLTFYGPSSLLLTGLTNTQVIRTAEILDFVAICFVRGKKPQPETLKLAEEQELPLLVSNLPMYECCGRLYKNGLSSVEKGE